MKIIFIIIAMLLLVGCAQEKDFNYGVEKLKSINAKYNTTFETYPRNVKQLDAMKFELEELRKISLINGKEAFEDLINYRMLNIEAEKLYIDGQKYGSSGFTSKGFGCKQRPLIIESADLRNKSALKGFEAVTLLEEFIKNYPNEANQVELTEKNALFLNATFYRISKDATTDSNIINHFCPENVTLEIYQNSFKKNTNLSEDYINKLTYAQAVEVWKESIGLK